VRYAISFRADFGFQSDEPFVRSTFDDPDGFPGSDWGLPLSPSEAADLDERGRLRTLVQPAIDHASAQRDSAGMWSDQQQGGKAFFRFTSDLVAHEAELAQLMPPEAAWEVVPAGYSMAQLRSLQETIADDFAELVAAGIPVTQIVASARHNTVLVGLEEADAEAEAELQSRYGSAVSTELIGPTQDDTCANRDDCRPLMGGLKIRPQGSSTYFCSSAFQAEKDGERMLVTAGHCIQDWGNGHIWENGADRFGTGGNHPSAARHHFEPGRRRCRPGLDQDRHIGVGHAGQPVHPKRHKRHQVVRPHRGQQRPAGGRPGLPQRGQDQVALWGHHQHRRQQGEW
jgi:hypothetical protein